MGRNFWARRPMSFERKYPDEALEWAKAHCAKMSGRKMSVEIKRLFGIDVNASSLNYYVRRYGRGVKHNPHSPVSFAHKEVGTERVDKDGYVRVVVADGKERLKHHLVWETINPPVKKDEVLIFLNGDKTNCDLSNLFLLKRKCIPQLTWFVKRAGEITPEQRKTLILTAMLSITAKEKEIIANKDNIHCKPKNDNWRTFVELRNQGLTTNEISEKTGKCPSVIRWSLRRYDLGVYDD